MDLGFLVVWLRQRFFSGVWFASGNISERFRDVGKQGCIYIDEKRGTSRGIAKHHLFRDFQRYGVEMDREGNERLGGG